MEKRLTQALKDNGEAIIDEWVSLAQNSSIRYKKIPKSELKENITKHFYSLIDIFENRNYDTLSDFLKVLAETRSEMGLDAKETQIVFLNGQSVLLKFLDDLRGKRLEFCGNCREVTEGFNASQIIYAQIFKELQLEKTKKSYQQEIKEKELRLSTLTEGTADAVIILSEDLRILSWNRGAEEIYLYKKDEIIGQHLSIIVPQDRLFEGELQKLNSIVLGTGSLKNYQTSRIRKDGKLLTVNITCTELRNESGEIIGISSIHRDLTEKMQLEHEIRSQEQFLSSIVDNSVDAIIGLDLGNRILSWNEGAEKIFGYTKAEVIGKTFDMLLPHEAQESGELKQLHEQLMRDGSIQNYEGERITKSGKRITISLTRSLIRDKKKGKVIGSSAILRDVTEYKRLKLQMSHSEKLSVVGQLAAGIAHEVGNPLTSISSLIQVLSRSEIDDEIKDKLVLIKKQTDRITTLIRDLVNFSQPSGSNIKQSDINSIINESLSIIQYDKRARECKFETRLGKNLPLMRLPEDQVLQVFINILLNAMDAIPVDSGKIFIKSSKRNGAVSVKFLDNGVGMPEHIQDKIFDPFFTTKSVGRGTGLGLWVSYSIIESLDGKISVRSKENEGSEFIVEIPITS
ncbi:PAS domain S-box protein [candidate division KSB1 bacterium]